MSNSKEEILEKIRANKPDSIYGHPEISLFQKGRKTLLKDDFRNNLTQNSCKWYDVEEKSEALKLMEELYPDAKVICSATKEFDGNKDLSVIKDPHDLADVDLGIIRAQFGVAENGMVWMSEKDMINPGLGFLSEHLIILLKPNQLVRNMHEAYLRIRLKETSYGCFMMGPSATGDIGVDIIHGAHGPRTMTVFFM